MAKKHAPRFLEIVNDAKSRVAECTVDQIKSRLDAGDMFHLVDVREESEYARGHLPGAVHIGKGVIERDIEAKIPRHRRRDRAVLWRRIPLGPGSRRPAEDGV